MGKLKQKTPAPQVTAPTQPQLPFGVPAVQRPGVATNSMSPLQWNMGTIGPAKATHYFPIPLGGSTPGRPVTGVFLPIGFSYQNPVDVILFFHGDRTGDYAFDHIDEYWGGNYPKKKAAPSGPVVFRDDLNGSGKNAILIAPTLGKTTGHFFEPALIGDFAEKRADEPGGFLEKVMQELARVEPRVPANSFTPAAAGFDGPPKVGKIILAAHSGGGFPLLRQVQMMPQNRVCEIWSFDSTYGTKIPAKYGTHIADAWREQIIYNTSTKFFYHFGTESPTKHSQELQAMVDEYKLQNAFFSEGPKGDHFGVLTENFSKRLATKCLKP